MWAEPRQGLRDPAWLHREGGGAGELVRSPPAPAVPQERVLRPAPPDGPGVEVRPPHLPCSKDLVFPEGGTFLTKGQTRAAPSLWVLCTFWL